MSNLKRYRFCDLYTMSSGISTTKDQAGHGSPFLSFSVVFNNYFVPDELTDLMATSDKEKDTYSIKSGDIFLTRTSEVVDELAMSCVAVKDYPNASYSGFLKRLRPIQTDITYSKFMAFYLRSPMFRKIMTNNAVMTLRASLNEAIFSYLDLLLPDFDDQVKAGDLLYLLNEKIEINKRINAELEVMAKTLYDYWFVQFDFPDANGKPYKTSGGKMVYNSALKREIPEGWSDASLVDIATFTNGIACQKYYPNGDEPTYKVIKIREFSSGFDDSSESVHQSVPKKVVVNDGDILFSWSATLEVKLWSGGVGVLNQHIFKITSENYPTTFFYFETLKYLEYFKMVADLRKTTMGHITKEHLVASRIAIPPKDIIQIMDIKLSPIIKKMVANHQQNIELEKLRDWLLPMLMNGQVTVA